MARLALEIQKNVPRDPSGRVDWVFPSSYTTAPDTVSTFLADTVNVPHLIADIT